MLNSPKLLLTAFCSNLSTTRFLAHAANPARSCQYVPASDQRKLSKIFKSHSDLLVLDCEDGVALNRKHQARQNIYDLLSSEPRMDDNKFAVRINAPQTELAFEDIKAFFSATTTPRTIFVPKTNHPDDINWLFSSIQKQISPNFPKSLKFFFYMESATSLLNLRELIETANELSSSKHRSLFKLDGFVFGSDDFCADIGAERTRDASELTYARQKLVAHCKAYKLKAIDMVFIDYKDLDGLRTQAEQGARMGFTGKQVIHPGQVDVVQRAFMPSEARIRWARGLVEAFNSHQMSGSGAFIYEGQMIDMPSLLQAENVLSIVDRVAKDT